MDQSLQQDLSVSPVLKKDLKAGDHILVKGNMKDLHPSLKPLCGIVGEFYFHHGIYIGNDEVVDFGGTSKSNAKPRRLDIFEFLRSSCDSTLYRAIDAGGKVVSHTTEIVSRALEMVKNPSKWPEYNVFWNNCESFANYLKTGKAYTEQGKKALKIALSKGILSGASISASGFSGFSGRGQESKSE